jgi:hypothetical protein
VPCCGAEQACIVTEFLGRWVRGTVSRYVVRYLREIFTLRVKNEPVNPSRESKVVNPFYVTMGLPLPTHRVPMPCRRLEEEQTREAATNRSDWVDMVMLSVDMVEPGPYKTNRLIK